MATARRELGHCPRCSERFWAPEDDPTPPPGQTIICAWCLGLIRFTGRSFVALNDSDWEGTPAELHQARNLAMLVALQEDPARDWPWIPT